MDIRDIAQLASVSPATVSRVFNAKTGVGWEVRARVMELLHSTGYVPDHAARALASKRNCMVGLVLPESFNMFQRQLFSTIERFLEAFGYRTLFFFVNWEPKSESKCLRRIKAERLDGIIMMHEVIDPRFYDYLVEASKPVVLCTFEREEYGFPSVHVDEGAAAWAATRHLIGLGHREIGLISGARLTCGPARTAGYRSALESAGIPFGEDRIAWVPSYGFQEGRAAMRELISRRKDLTAVFAITDELAIGAVRALYETGLSVPGDVSIVGIDDLDICSHMTPGLTTVRQPIHDMGRRTAQIMSALIAGEEPEPGPILFSHRLVVRESSRARADLSA